MIAISNRRLQKRFGALNQGRSPARNYNWRRREFKKDKFGFLYEHNAPNHYERAIGRKLCQMGVTTNKFVFNIRTIIPPYELDIFIPLLNIAVEIQGYHHYEDPKQIRRDAEKVKICNRVGIRLIPLPYFALDN